MNNSFSHLVDKLWENTIPEHFGKGKINNSRQLSTHLFHEISNQAAHFDIEVWASPSLFWSDIIEGRGGVFEPDLVILSGKSQEIIAMVWIRVSLWQNTNLSKEIEVANLLAQNIKSGAEVLLGRKPYSYDWKRQKFQKNFDCYFKISPSFTQYFFVIHPPDDPIANIMQTVDFPKSFYSASILRKGEFVFNEPD